MVSMKEVSVKFLKTDNTITNCILKYADTPPWAIEVSLEELSKTRFEGDDLFSALCDLRCDLDKAGIKLLCNGCRIDTYVSRMSRQMGGGRKVYELTMKKQAGLDSLVDIFGEAPVDKIGTVEEQKTFYQKWLDSLG
jgi:hypothetical protein